MKKIFFALLAIASLNMMAAGDAAEVMKNLKSRIAPDKRTAIWDVKTSTKGETVTVTGSVGLQEQKNAISKELADKGFTNVQNNVKVIQDGVPAGKRWAQVMLAVASMRCTGDHAGEMATQGIMGQPVRVIDCSGDWYRVQTPDMYISYVPSSSVVFKTEAQMKAWKEAKRYIVTAYETNLVTEAGGDEVITDLVMGSILEYKGEKANWVQLATPDGRVGWVSAKEVAEFSEWAKQNFDAKKIEATARHLLGHGYLWGGTSTKVTDCSGLVKVSYFNNGIILARDASQQALYGKIIKGTDWKQCKLGDLLFFGKNRVTHVGIYLYDGKFIHCSGRVKINSLYPNAKDYLYSPRSCTRIDGMIGTPFITYVRDHSWYFNKEN